MNLSGRKGGGIEMDAWVETCIVQPIKVSTSGHTTVKTCQKIVSNIDYLKLTRDAFLGINAFNEHTSKRHSVPSPFPDQVKGT